ALVLPSALLMAVARVPPLYVDRYVLYSLAGAPLLAAAGAERLAGIVCRLRSGRRRLPDLVPWHDTGGMVVGRPSLPETPRPAGSGVALQEAPRVTTCAARAVVRPPYQPGRNGAALFG